MFFRYACSRILASVPWKSLLSAEYLSGPGFMPAAAGGDLVGSREAQVASTFCSRVG